MAGACRDSSSRGTSSSELDASSLSEPLLVLLSARGKFSCVVVWIVRCCSCIKGAHCGFISGTSGPHCNNKPGRMLGLGMVTQRNACGNKSLCCCSGSGRGCSLQTICTLTQK